MIKVICVGKIKEKFYGDAIEIYIKSISKHEKIEIIQLIDEKTPDKASKLMENKIKDTEGNRILGKICEDDYVIALCIEGKMIDAKENKKIFRNAKEKGFLNIDYVIGGSLGLSKNVVDRADYKLSFSKLTFPHQLMRVMLLEEINKVVK